MKLLEATRKAFCENLLILNVLGSDTLSKSLHHIKSGQFDGIRFTCTKPYISGGIRLGSTRHLAGPERQTLPKPLGHLCTPTPLQSWKLELKKCVLPPHHLNSRLSSRGGLREDERYSKPPENTSPASAQIELKWREKISSCTNNGVQDSQSGWRLTDAEHHARLTKARALNFM
ncbi:hypothetical protein AVEN_266334-1 [Araneus ventricosus]|uniref:Uncharacterized protein n=1 Tax=Araneus ventricosus TaxID=182803 RepID=A0A4Y2U575_ARAVE|nr:hypothetical protein AVEN_266334-1 [Araneus ventricosus]